MNDRVYREHQLECTKLGFYANGPLGRFGPHETEDKAMDAVDAKKRSIIRERAKA